MPHSLPVYPVSYLYLAFQFVKLFSSNNFNMSQLFGRDSSRLTSMRRTSESKTHLSHADLRVSTNFHLLPCGSLWKGYILTHSRGICQASKFLMKGCEFSYCSLFSLRRLGPLSAWSGALFCQYVHSILSKWPSCTKSSESYPPATLGKLLHPQLTASFPPTSWVKILTELGQILIFRPAIWVIHSLYET